MLKNRLGIKSQEQLDQFEALSVALRSDEPLPRGRFTPTHYRAIHRHLFGDVYIWAGRYRTVGISKDKSAFCYPEHIPEQMSGLFGRLADMDRLRGRNADEFAAGASHFLADLNAIPPFREGNGRTQLAFMTELATQTLHPLDLRRLEPKAFLQAMIASFFGQEADLRRQLRAMIG